VGSGKIVNQNNQRGSGFCVACGKIVSQNFVTAKLKGITIYRQTKRSPRKKTGAQAMCMSKLTYYDKLAVGVLFF